MAFCNSCGNNLQPGAKFCPKCGASQPLSGTVPVASPVATTPTAAPAAQGTPAQGSNALKVILIVVGVIVVLGAISIGSLAFFAWHVARRTHVRNDNGNVHIESPFGTVDTSSDPDQTAKNLGVDLYPGAKVEKDGAANINLGGMHTIAANFTTDDSPDKVAQFYRSKYPNANVNVGDGDHYTIVSTENKNLLTITIEPQDGKTQIHIANVSGKGVGSSGD